MEDIKQLLGNEYPRITEQEQSDLEGILSVQEATVALGKLNNDKSPGPDGFSTNFFKVFWKELGHFLVRSLNAGFSAGMLSVTQRQGQITLVPKPGKNKNDIHSWRPISLLNTSLKILSAAIANRIRNVLAKLIAPSQKGFMKNRFIGECIRSVYDVMWDAKHLGKDCLMLFADYRRAFDSLNHEFIFEVLELFNFGPDLIRWVKIMLRGAISCISQNKTSTEFFSIGQGCRQGDCCSPLLFILCVEILSIAVRNAAHISGYVVNGIEIKVEQFADDCTFILDGTRKSFESTLRIISEFSLVSGLSLNIEKTKVLWLGGRALPKYLKESVFGHVEERFKYLGIIFTKEMNDMSVVNFETKVIDIRNLLKGWMRRRLTVYGKRTVLKSLVLSKLTNVLTTLPCPPSEVIRDLQNAIFSFVWNNGPDKIKRNFMILNYGIPCVKTFNDSLKISWIKRYICSADSWKLLAEYVMPSFDLLFTCGDRSSTKITVHSANPFWREVIAAWDLFKTCYNDVRSYGISAQPILLSSLFRRDCKVVWNKHLYMAGCTSAGDFWTREGRLMDFTEWKDSYRVSVQQLEHMGIVRAIRTVHAGNVSPRLIGPLLQPALSVALGVTAGCGIYYKQLVIARHGNSKDKLKSQSKWNAEFGRDLDWDFIYKSFQNCTKNTTLLWFQDKITHRILTTNTFISKFTSISPMCTFCAAHRETLIHLFVDCERIQIVWINIEEWIRNRLNLNFRFTKQIIMMGLNEDISSTMDVKNAIQRIILMGKYYIYRTKARQGRIKKDDLETFIAFHTGAEFSSGKETRSENESTQSRVHTKLCMP